MIGSNTVDWLIGQLWPPEEWAGYEVWAVLDGARSAGIHDMLAASYRPKSVIPFGRLDPALQRAAPQLLQLRPNDLLTKRLLHQAWGQAWGIFLRSDAPLLSLRRHLASLLVVQDEARRRLVFRYYDPRVLRVFLPTCLEAELATVFGPVLEFLAEEDGAEAVLRYRRVKAANAGTMSHLSMRRQAAPL